jgi:microcystin degradation protein MlrC
MIIHNSSSAFNMNKRVGIIGLLHESNTFIRSQTTLQHFQQDTLAIGTDVRTRFFDAPHEIGGFFHGLAAADIEAVPIFAARAIPYGPITADAYQELIDQMLAALDDSGPLDGVLAAPHGASVSESVLDVDGHWLRLVRERLGNERPIIATIDAHANVSEQMVESTDALVAYRTNPHLDQFDRGVEAAGLMAGTLRTGRRLKQVAELMPLVINIQSQNTGEPPLREIGRRADRIREAPEVASLSLVLGFPFADVPEMGSSAILVSYEDIDAERQNELLADLVAAVDEAKDQFEPRFVDASAAVAEAGQCSGTSCLLDMGDNVGGGSPADGTVLALELHAQRIGPSFVCLCDPAAIDECSELQLGELTTIKLGGKSDPNHGAPLDVEVRILSRHDGRFHEPKPMHGGFTQFDQGETMIVESVTSSLTIMLTQKRIPPFSLAQLTSFGVEPRRFRAIVAKGVIAPMAAYEAVVDRFIHVNTPGTTCADMKQLDYKHRRRPMFPFE